jgi:hypothetical protein
VATETYLTADEVRVLLDERAFPQLVHDLHLGRVPWLFREDADLYEQFRTYLADSLGVASSGISLVGSACAGFSLSPDSFPRPFNEGSDIDVAIVSEQLFDAAWMTMVAWGHPRRNSLPAGELEWMQERQAEVFYGWLQFSHLRFRGLRFPKTLSPLREIRAAWFTAFQAVGTNFPDTEFAAREVSGRLYRTTDHLVLYQAESLRRLQYALSQRSNPETTS